MVVSPQSKVQVVFYPALPGTCMVCHKSANGETPFLDWNMSLDYYGAVSFCTDCAKEILTVIDYVPVAEVEALQKRVDYLQDALRKVEEENERLNGTLDSVFSLRPNLRDLDDRVDDVDSEDSESGTKGTSGSKSKSS